MAKNQSPSKSSEGVCERIHRVVNGRSPFKSLRRGSPRHQNSNVSVVFNHNDEDHNNVASNPPILLHHRPRNQEAEVKRATIADDYYNHKQNQEKHHEAHFSEYIARVRERISRTMTHVGGSGEGGGGGNVRKAATMKRDSFNDRVSNYINRARLNIRKGSNVGGDHGDGTSV